MRVDQDFLRDSDDTVYIESRHSECEVKDMSGIKQLGVNIFGSIAAVTVFILMLPLTIIAMSMLFISGLIGVMVLRYKLRQMQPSVVAPDAGLRSSSMEDPKGTIEGSYRVIKD